MTIILQIIIVGDGWLAILLGFMDATVPGEEG